MDDTRLSVLLLCSLLLVATVDAVQNEFVDVDFVKASRQMPGLALFLPSSCRRPAEEQGPAVSVLEAVMDTIVIQPVWFRAVWRRDKYLWVCAMTDGRQW